MLFLPASPRFLAVARGEIGFGGVASGLSSSGYLSSTSEDSRLALPMASNELISAQFDRAVEIVQGLPKTGPIQTDYEEKLAMYR